jgi:hypothetical protein
MPKNKSVFNVILLKIKEQMFVVFMKQIHKTLSKILPHYGQNFTHLL